MNKPNDESVSRENSKSDSQSSLYLPDLAAFAAAAFDGDSEAPFESPSTKPAGLSSTLLDSPGSDSDLLNSIGNYDIVEEIGKGGMGSVLKAIDRKLGRVVAIKLIQSRQISHQTRERFLTEARAIARLNDPNILTIYEVGEHEGRPFLTMEFVDGGTLSELIAVQPMDWRLAGDIMFRVASAVQHAHSQGIIHRDVKPANILLDKSGAVKVADFGLAKILDDDSELSIIGLAMGTPSYMPPEQARGEVGVGVAADVYSMGATLYAAVTGRPPFRASSPGETLEQVKTQEAVSPRMLNRSVPRDLETICLKCLQKDPKQRYETALAFGTDLKLLLDGHPIRARPISDIERLWRWCKRNPVAAVATVVFVSMLVLATLVSLRFASEAGSQAQTATKALHDLAREKVRADENATDATAKKTLAEAREIEANTHRNAAESRLRDAQAAAYNLTLLEAAASVATNPDRAEKLLVDEAICPSRLRDFAWRYLYSQSQRESFRLSRHATPIRHISWNQSKGALVATEEHDDVTVWSTQPLTHRDTFEGFAATAVDDDTIVILSKSGVQRLRLGSRDVVREFTVEGEVVGGLCSPNGEFVALFCKSDRHSRVELWNSEVGLKLSDTESTRWSFALPFGAAFSGDSKVFAILTRVDNARAGNAIEVFELSDNSAKRTKQIPLSRHASQIALSQDGQKLAYAFEVDMADQLAPTHIVHDIATSQTQEVANLFTGHFGAHTAMTFVGSKRLATGDRGGVIKVWNLEPLVLEATIHSRAGAINTMGQSPDGDSIVSGTRSGVVVSHLVKPRKPKPEEHFEEVHHRLLADTEIAEFNKKVAILQPEDNDIIVAGERTERLAIVRRNQKDVEIWDGLAGRMAYKCIGHQSAVWGMAFSPDEGQLATGGTDRRIILWDSTSGERLKTLFGHRDQVLSLLYAPDGASLWSGAMDGELIEWDLATGVPLKRLAAQERSIYQIAISPDGRSLATTGLGGAIRIWDPSRLQVRATLHDSSPDVQQLRFVDNNILISRGMDGIVRWDGNRQINSGNRPWSDLPIKQLPTAARATQQIKALAQDHIRIGAEHAEVLIVLFVDPGNRGASRSALEFVKVVQRQAANKVAISIAFYPQKDTVGVSEAREEWYDHLPYQVAVLATTIRFQQGNAKALEFFEKWLALPSTSDPDAFLETAVREYAVTGTLKEVGRNKQFLNRVINDLACSQAHFGMYDPTWILLVDQEFSKGIRLVLHDPSSLEPDALFKLAQRLAAPPSDP